MSVPFMAALDPLEDETAVVPVQSFELRETVNDGWTATVTVVEDFETPVSSAGLLGNLLANQVRPGSPVALHLLVAGEGVSAGEVVRIWPSVVTSITPFREEEEDRAACKVRMRDIVGFHSGRGTWCAYRDMTLAEMFGGVISSAGFGDGVPSTTPRLWPKIDVSIEQNLRDELSNISYTISAGDSLRTWIDNVFGQLGVRYEMLGTQAGTVRIMLHDQAPSHQPILMELIDKIGVREADRTLDVTRMTLRDVQFLNAGSDKRAMLLDSAGYGGYQRIGTHGSVGSVISDPSISIEEATLRSEFATANSSLNSVRLIGTCSQSALHPCNRIRFTGGTVAATNSWQVVEVEHGYRDGDYLNVSLMLRDYDAWRPPAAPITPPILITGMVNAEDTEAKREVPRDELGRVPVVFPFLPVGNEDEATAADMSSSTAPPPTPQVNVFGVQVEEQPEPDDSSGTSEDDRSVDDKRQPRIHLSMLEPMAGGRHGMVSAARQGNVCRVSVYNPLFAEIVGFGYRSNMKIGKDFTDVSLGMLTRHTPEGLWAGMLFRPTKGVTEKSEEDEADEDMDELLADADAELEALIEREQVNADDGGTTSGSGEYKPTTQTSGTGSGGTSGSGGGSSS